MLRYDSSNIFETKSGLRKTEYRSFSPKLKKAKEAVLALSAKGEQGFLKLPSERFHLESSARVLESLPKNTTDLIVFGIGGSDLGGRMLLESIGNGKKLKVHFGGSSTDPDEVYRLLHSVDFKKTCINIVSKSGGTIEPMASFLLARDLLISANGAKKAFSKIIATTDPKEGALYDLAKKEGYGLLSVPSNVGGRFSVLSSVGLFPLLADGGDASKLLSGARYAAKKFASSPETDHCDISQYAGAHISLLSAGKSIHVLMPYVARLKSFGQWYRQLFAESLGKKQNRRNTDIFAGLTPVAALGPEDQHSQLQLYGEGPRDKTVTFIEAEGFERSLKTPHLEAGEPIKGYGGIRMTDIIHAERAATAESLKRQGCPNDTIYIPMRDAESLGELIVFFEAAVAMMGELLDVNAFDQPGVELSKKLMKEAFGSH